MKAILKPLDIVILCLSITLILLIVLGIYAAPRKANEVIIRGQDKTWIFPLDAEEQIQVPGPLGNTLVEIHGGKAAIVSSPCKNQTCVERGHLNRSGQWTACLPNNVFLLIEGVHDDLDAVSW